MTQAPVLAVAVSLVIKHGWNNCQGTQWPLSVLHHTAGKLGGVHRKTREAMLICEAAGFDVILIETVGVGQSEVIIRDMVDFFMLLVLTGAGDELQGMKKGIMELADAILVHKADGANKQKAEQTRKEYNRILHFLQPATKGWHTKAYTCSSLTKRGN